MNVAVFVDCYVAWAYAGSSQNSGCAVWSDFCNVVRCDVGGVDVAGVVDCYRDWA